MSDFVNYQNHGDNVVFYVFLLLYSLDEKKFFLFVKWSLHLTTKDFVIVRTYTNTTFRSSVSCHTCFRSFLWDGSQFRKIVWVSARCLFFPLFASKGDILSPMKKTFKEIRVWSLTTVTVSPLYWGEWLGDPYVRIVNMNTQSFLEVTSITYRVKTLSYRKDQPSLVLHVRVNQWRGVDFKEVGLQSS